MSSIIKSEFIGHWHAASTTFRCRYATQVVPIPVNGRISGVQTPSKFNAHNYKRICVLAAAAEQADGQTQPAAVGDPLRTRRMERQQRRAARKKSIESQEVEVSDSESPDDVEEADTQPSSSVKPLSRIAARRQQRKRHVRRVPAAIVPDNDDIAAAEEEEEEEEEDSIDADAAVNDEWDMYAEDEQTSESEAAADTADAEADEDGSVTTYSQQLPTSVLEAASQTSSSNQQAQRPRQQQQEGKSEPKRLYDEANPLYQPILTDEDLEKDPPGHKSGYVAVIGRPNAGKSTLINAIIGQKLSIVTFKPQTTRHRVVGIASGEDYQMILFDTPGIMQEQRSKLDERMMAAVVSSIKAAEVIIAVVDAGDKPQEALAMFQPGPDWDGPPMAVLLNKADTLKPEQIAELEAWYKTNCRAEQVFVGSALSNTNEGVSAIKAWAIGKLPEGPTLYPKSMVSEQPERFFVSEIIREQIFLQYQQEIPYCCQVQIAEFKERPGAKDYINAVVLVERESQAAIVLGKDGKALRRLGSAARQQIEEFLERQVYLELSVQVAPAWRTQSDKLKDFGYFDPLYIT